LMTLLDTIADHWRPQSIIFESNGAFAAVRDILRRDCRCGPRITGITQSESKLGRAAALSVPVQTGAVLLAADGSQRELFEEMTTFPFGEHDDLLDALATGVLRLLGGPPEPRVFV
jgi:predicted phage terminase large subunit-like protein